MIKRVVGIAFLQAVVCPSGLVAYGEAQSTTGVNRDVALSARALETLLQPAELRLGVGRFSYQKDDEGRYVASYESSVCPVPGRTRLQVLVATGHPEVELEARRLAVLADVDESLSITDAEALSLAQLLDFGIRLTAATAQVGRSGGAVADLMRLQKDLLVRQLGEYATLVDRGTRLGVSLPKPAVLEW